MGGGRGGERGRIWGGAEYLKKKKIRAEESKQKQKKTRTDSKISAAE